MDRELFVFFIGRGGERQQHCHEKECNVLATNAGINRVHILSGNRRIE
jgi:hypothetical protein